MARILPETTDSPIVTTAVEITTSDVTGISFELNTAAFRQDATGTVTVDGLAEVLPVEGAPALPYFVTTLILPPEALAVVSVAESAVSTQQVAPVPPVPQPTFAGMDTVDDGFSPYALVDDTGEVIGYASPGLATVEDTAVYNHNALYPQAIYDLSQPAYLRDFRLVELRLYPLQYNPVTGELRQAQTMEVQVEFVGARWEDLRPSASYQNTFQHNLSDQALNYEQGQQWRSLPNTLQNVMPTQLPIGNDVYKIEINQDGIYELTGADFAAAGMDISNTDPNTLQMLYRGQPMAYQLINSNGDNDFDPDEKIRFYGWAFEGARTEKQFVNNNVLWLWAGGTPTYMVDRLNKTNMGYPVDTNFWAEITREPENSFFSSWTRWETLPNEPDSWYWDYINKPFDTITRTYTTTLFHPETAGPDAIYLLEYIVRKSLTTQPHLIHTQINNNPAPATFTWLDPSGYVQTNINLTDSVPISDINHGQNTITATYATTTKDQLYLNRITVEYMRQLLAVNDQLLFQDEQGSAREFHVSSFTEGSASNVLVWDVSVPTGTVEIEMNGNDIVPDGGTFVYKIGSDQPAGSRFLVTTAANILTAAHLANNISQYMPPSLDPPGGVADWLAISHSDFMTQAVQLGNHRASGDYGGLITHTVDIADVIEQYGYGLPLPAAVQSYLRHALANWTVAPSYATLVGDATHNPRNLDCTIGCSVWDADAVNYVLTDLPFVDRFQGMIPSDLRFSLLSGDDLLADLAVGRIPVKTPTEATNVVAKIIEFEANQYDPAHSSWQNDTLFVADNYDPQAGNFCSANMSTAAILPSSFDQTHLCLPGVDGVNPPTPEEVAVVRQAMSETVNITGTTLLNYRGHGAINRWTGNGLLTTQMSDIWQNNGRPFMILSADCLDGYFASTSSSGLGETFLKLDDRGTAAHWASSGLGFTFEHSILHQNFYNGVFVEGLTAVGDAANHAKFVYLGNGGHESEAYSFNLQGDPAMQLYRPDIRLSKQALQPEVDPGNSVDFLLTVHNNGLAPTYVVVTDTLPPELSFINVTASAPTYAPVISGNQVSLEFIDLLAVSDSFLITLTASTVTDFIGVTTNWATAIGVDSEVNPVDNTAGGAVTSTVPSVILTLFTAEALDNAVQLDWTISQEVNIDSYRVTRSEEGGPFIWLQNLGNNGYIPSQGNVPTDYAALDDTVQNGRSYRYRLFAVQDNGSEFSLGMRAVALSPYASQLAFIATPLNNEVSLRLASDLRTRFGRL